MRVASLAIVGLACAIAACSPPAQAPADGGSSSAGGGSSASMANAIQPGQYRTTMTVLGMDIPGVKQSTINMAPTTTEDCVTSTDVGDFTRGNLVDADEGETCTQNSVNTAGGHIEGTASCTGENGARTMHMTGTYTSNHVDMTVEMSGQMNGGTMTQRIHLVTDRIGECTTGTN